MSNGSTTTAGLGGPSSFEDCPTNVFQIAELNGLKWCALTSGNKSLQQELDSSNPDEEECPIMRAYTECLEADLLCTWRRRPPSAGVNSAYLNPTPNQDDPKEIWLFWYAAEEPELINEFKSRGMIELTHSESMDTDTPRIEFEYETRTLFFKALNGAIERRLLLEGYVRFGRWLCKPVKMNSFNKCAIPKFINAIRFNYFLHRDSLVCASIAVQRQPTILRLSQSHLKESRVQPVILGPWSIRAQLAPGQTFLFDNENGKNVDESPHRENKDKLKQLIEKQWIGWKRIYPALENPKVSQQMPKGLPKMLLVQVNGKSLLYPSAFIGILADEQLAPVIKMDENLYSNDSILDDCAVATTSMEQETDEMIDGRIKRERKRISANVAIARTSFGDSCLRFPGTAAPKNVGMGAIGCMSEFNYDYMRREFCYCRICPKLGQQPNSIPPQQQLENKQQNLEQPQNSQNHDVHSNNFNRLPFHRNIERINQKQQQNYQINTKKYTEPKKERRKCAPPKWIAGLASLPNENAQKLPTKREQFDQKNQFYGKYRTRIAQQQELIRINEMTSLSDARITSVKEENNQAAENSVLKGILDEDEEDIEEDITVNIIDISQYQFYMRQNQNENPIWRPPGIDEPEKPKEKPKTDEPEPEKPTAKPKRKRKYNQIGSTKTAKRLKWPSVVEFDFLNIAFEEEDSNIFAIDPCNSLPSISNNEEVKSESLLMKLLLSPNTVPMPIDDPSERLIDENATAETPPFALDGHEQMETNENEMVEELQSSSSTAVNTPYQQQQHTPTTQCFMSPPASNECIDAAAGNAATATILGVGNIYQTITANPNAHIGQTHQNAHAAALQESLSRIYPTPPTPLQFSPLNMLHHQSINEEGVINIISHFSAQMKNAPWKEPLYGAVECQKAHSREFCRRFLGNSTKIVENEDFCSNETNNMECGQSQDECCCDCLSIKNENEQEHSSTNIHRAKRPCCEQKHQKKYQYNAQPNAAFIALHLHTMAQRRSAADTNLEIRLHQQEMQRFQQRMEAEHHQQQQQYPPSFYLSNQGNVTPFPLTNQQQMLHQMAHQHQQQIARPSDFMNPIPPDQSQQFNSGANTPTLFGAKQTSASLQRNASRIGLLNSPASNSMLALTPTPTTSNSMAITGRPSSTNSSFLHAEQNRNFIEHQIGHFENKSSIIAFLIQDTIADLHYDIVFDACPLCCCNSNIRSYELGFYIIGPKKLLNRCDQLQQKQRQMMNQFICKQWSGFRIPTAELQKCMCGFSAVRHRYLCGQESGLFPDDIEEACGTPIFKSNEEIAARLLHFNPTNLIHIRIVDLLRHLMLSRDINTLTRSNNLNQLWRTQKSIDYVQSPIDKIELNKLIEEIFKNNEIDSTSVNNADDSSTLHPWGYQWADSVGEPRDTECLGIFEELRETLRDPHSPSLVPGYSNPRRLEQFTLRTFARNNKNILNGGNGKDEENSRPEPIPSLMALSNVEREFVSLQPQMIRHWEQLELMPMDQPKDLLYLALVPDVNVVAEKCKIFMEEITSMYEKRCRLGTHIRLNTKETPRDAIFRVGRSISPASSMPINNAISHAFNELFAKSRIISQIGEQNLEQIKNYVELCFHELMHHFSGRDSVFDRRAYLESAYRQQQGTLSTSLASPPDANAMPPPAVPGSSTMLFTSNGPASATASTAAGALNENMTGPGSASAYSPNLILHHQRQQQSPSAGNGPNSVPNLQGSSSNSNMAESSNTQSGIETADEQAKREDKLAKDIREQVEFELAKEPPQLPHTIVVYIINPFGQQLGSRNDTGAGDTAKHLGTLATAALFCAWNEFIATLPFKRRTQLQLEIIPLCDIYDYVAFIGMGHEHFEINCCSKERSSAWDSLRRLAFTIYSQPRLLHPEVAMGALSKNMTSFGTGERMKDIFQMLGENPLFIKKNCSPYLLAPTRTINFLNQSSNNNPLNVQNGAGGPQSITNGQKLQLFNAEDRILLMTYCLLPKEDMLCAAVTDERGSLLDTALINLAIPSALPPTEPQKEWRHKHRHSQIADALQRLWHFIQSVILGQEVHQWRLIISRMGKLGHGEFKIWNELLSKRNLRAYNSSLKNNRTAENLMTQSSDGLAVASNCSACSNSHGWQEAPAILSACLISTEPEPHLRVFGSHNGMALNGGDGQMGGGIGANIGVGNTANSAGGKIGGGTKNGGKQSSLQAQQWQQQAPEDRTLTHIVVFPTILNVSLHQQEDTLHGGMDDELTDFMRNFGGDEEAPEGIDGLLEGLEFDESARNEEEAPIDNQPMAIGFTISTAPVWTCPEGEMCSGLAAFWSNCSPSIRQRRLAHLKSSLHINSTNLLQSDEYQQSTGTNKVGGVAGTSTTTTPATMPPPSEQHAPHPLDMASTDEVLRFALETQNALSWLSLDSVTGSRCSCLPIHMQAVLRLAQAIASFYGRT